VVPQAGVEIVAGGDPRHDRLPGRQQDRVLEWAGLAGEERARQAVSGGTVPSAPSWDDTAAVTIGCRFGDEG
jgi:hypothetical protein